MAQDRRPGGADRSRGHPGLPLVAFDFDGTLTVRDSFTSFLKWRVGRVRYLLGAVRLLPAALRYLLDRDRGRIKARAAAEFLHGLSRAELEADAEMFAEEFAPSLFRPDALSAWRRWRAEGAQLVIVSASPDVVLAPFAARLGADALIATEVAYDPEGAVVGAFATPNCRGPEKVVRLKAAFGEDVRLKAAYGDSSGDREMLQLAEIRGYKVFRGRP